MKKALSILFVILSVSLSACAKGGNNNSESEPSNDYYEGYYSSIRKNLSGGVNGELRQALTTLIKPKAYYIYEGSEVGALGYELQYYDEDPNNPNNMIMFYTQESIAKEKSVSAKPWNREHVWPQSKSGGLYGKQGAGTDLLHIRPTRSTTNGKRGNDVYGYVSGNSWLTYNGIQYGKKANGVFEPLDVVKGDCARITLYMWVCYFAERNTPITNNCTDIQTMIEWAKLDPVSQIEINRNNRVEASNQQNRNPFVDHPEWIDVIFG